MGKYCMLCKAVAIKGELNRSFHRFPAPQYQKEMWCQVVKKDIKKLPTWTFICSDHFSPDSFVYRSNGQRFLKDDAVPLSFTGKVERRKRRSKKLQYNIEHVNIKTECEEQELINTALDKDIKEENVYRFQENEEHIKSKKLQSSIEHVNIKTECEEQELINTALDKDIKEENVYRFQENEEHIKSKKLQSSIDHVNIKTQYEEELINMSLGKDIKLENLDSFQKSEEDIHSEKNKYSPEVLVKTEVVPLEHELTEELDIKSEESSRVSQLKNEDESKNNKTCDTLGVDNETAAACEESLSESDIDDDSGYFSLDKNDNFLRKMFKSIYPVTPGVAYTCPECLFKTSLRPVIRRHFLAHRDNEYKKDPEKYSCYKTFHCKQCKYVNIQRYNVTRHLLKHKPKNEKTVKIFYCDHCDYSSKYRCDLLQHRLKHEPDGRRCHCPKCPYKAYDPLHLRRHIETAHIENKRYKFECKKCSYKTDCMGHLNRHMRSIHVEDSTDSETNMKKFKGWAKNQRKS